MRFLVIASVSAALLLPAVPVFACEDGMQSSTVATTDLAAATKKDDKKPMKKAAKKHKKEKVEYLRAAPM